nr:16S rRNA (cytosine(967)-C(5))-methyltransferase RsmB [Melissococcus plutonius]
MKNTNKNIKSSVRDAALQAIERIDKGGAYSNLLLNEMIQSSQLGEKDSRLFTEIVYGTISRKLLLEYYLDTFIHKRKKVEHWVRMLLILSFYQLLYLDKVPDHAVINEAVEIAKRRGNLGTGKFVNGILRSLQRRGLPSLDEISDPIERLSIEISMPLWLVKKLIQQLGETETKKLGLSLFEKSHVSGRIDSRKISRFDAIIQLQKEGIEASESPISPYGIIAEKGRLATSSLFREGKLTIQDESSMLAAPTLQIDESNQVLDAYAAPGGKTTHIATFLNQQKQGKIIALDIHDHKLKLIKENAVRMQVSSIIKLEKLDARKVKEVYPSEYFDRILVDAPCSGLGLMRRKPDIKYRKTLQDIKKLAKIQEEIIESVVPTLKKGGILTYSTCTITQEENQHVIITFLKKHPEFKKIDIIGNEKVSAEVRDQMLTLYPHRWQTDGFFICCMQKVY